MPYAQSPARPGTNPNRSCSSDGKSHTRVHVKRKRVIGGIALVACLFSAGCDTVPMSYSQWKKSQDERVKFAQAGIPYKSPSQLREEAAEMRRVGQETTFATSSK